MIAGHVVLRTATAQSHARVDDDAFSGFDLTDRRSYARFLRAHARARGAIELALTDGDGLPPFRTRLDGLAADLAALATQWPEPMPLGTAFSRAALFGMLYVAEGSRLGGGILADRVGPSLPRRYLAAVHDRGEWRATLAVLDAAALDQPPSWLEPLIDGPRRTFELYGQSAISEGVDALADHTPASWIGAVMTT